MPGSRVVIACAFLLAGGPAGAAGAPPRFPNVTPRSVHEVPSVWPGAVEIGVSGFVTTFESVTEAGASARCGRFWGVAGNLLSVEADAGYRHRSSLNEIEFAGSVAWQARWKDTGNYPMFGVTAGIRHEEVGSFGLSRYPVGILVGWRSLLGPRSALRIDYRLRRILDDPVADYTEHEVRVGLSVFFRNSNPESAPAHRP